MAGLEHSRYKIFSKNQHPYNHRLSEFLYTNPSAPDVQNVEDALNFILSVLYPQTKGALEYYSDLPLVGNNLGDFYTVTDDANGVYDTPYTGGAPNPSWRDDGDHSQGVWTAGYIWHQYDGDTEPRWHKQVVYDWAVDDVVSELITRTAATYVHKRGLDDVDENGDLIVPSVVDPHLEDKSGQEVWGGQTENTNLTLNANNGDAPAVSSVAFAGTSPTTVTMTSLTYIMGQTFTTDASGLIADTVSIKPYNDDDGANNGPSSAGGDVSISIYATDGTFPVGAPLATSPTQAVTSFPNGLSAAIAAPYVDFPLGSTVNLSPNTKYAIVINSTGTTDYISTVGHTGNQYSGGSLIGDADGGGSGLTGWVQTLTHDISFIVSGAGGDVAHSGYVQFNDNVRPTKHETFDLGTLLNKFREVFTRQISIGVDANRLTIMTDAVRATIDSTLKDIDFVDNDLTTTARVSAGEAQIDLININGNNITSGDGEIGFDNENLTTSGTVDAGRVDTLYLEVDTTTIDNAVLTDTTDQFTLDVLTTIFTGVARASSFEATNGVNTTTVDHNSIVTDSTTLTIDATTDILLNKDATVQNIDGLNGDFESLDVDDVQIDANRIETTTTDTDLVLDADGTGHVTVATDLKPNTTDTESIGINATNQFLDAWLSGSIKKGLLEVAIDTLLTFRNSAGTDDGQVLFWDDTNSLWVASEPDAEIDHKTLSNISIAGGLAPTDDAGHDQFALLAGRAGGQDLIGGTTNVDRLFLRAYVGSSYITLDHLKMTPSMAGFQIGELLNPFGEIHAIGELKGPRVENRDNISGFPVVAALNASRGRFVWRTDASFKGLWVDDGTEYVRVGNRSYKNNTFTNLTLLGAHDVSPVVSEDAVWQVKDSTGEVISVTIRASNTNEITVSSDIPLSVGTYSLVGVEA